MRKAVREWAVIGAILALCLMAGKNMDFLTAVFASFFYFAPIAWMLYRLIKFILPRRQPCVTSKPSR